MQVEDPAPSGRAEERRLRRMEQYAASLSRASRSNERSDRRQRRPSAFLRAMSPSTLLRTVSLPNGLSNGSWTFYEAVIDRECMGSASKEGYGSWRREEGGENTKNRK